MIVVDLLVWSAEQISEATAMMDRGKIGVHTAPEISTR